MVSASLCTLYASLLLLCTLCELYDAAEYCHHQDFIARCLDNQVIVMTSAKYGRMVMGKCIKTDFGYMGCSVDVLDDVHARCSGRRTCRIHVPDPVFDQTKPCHEDLNNYLDAEYRCINVSTPEMERCAENATNQLTQSGYISSLLTIETGCGTESSPWLVVAQPGQRINITLMDFRRRRAPYRTPDAEAAIRSSEQILCKELAIVEEGDIRTPLSSCEGSGVIDPGGTRYTSMGHNVTLFIRSRALDGEAHFVIRYEILGCPDIEANKFTWVTREDDRISIGCLSTELTWHMTCVGTEWQGETGNCSAGEMKDPRKDGEGASVIIILVVSAVVGILVLLVGLFCMKRYRARRALRSDIPMKDIRPLNQDDGYDPDVLYARNSAFSPTRIKFSKHRIGRNRKSSQDHDYEYVWDMSGVTKGVASVHTSASIVAHTTPRSARPAPESPDVCHCPEIHVHVHHGIQDSPEGGLAQVSKVHIQSQADVAPRVVATICRTPNTCRRPTGSDVSSPRTLRAIKAPQTPSGCRKAAESTSHKHVTTMDRRKTSGGESHSHLHHGRHQCGGGGDQDPNGGNKRYWTLPVGKSAFKAKQNKQGTQKPHNPADSTG